MRKQEQEISYSFLSQRKPKNKLEEVKALKSQTSHSDGLRLARLSVLKVP